ncbi:4Fe-4S dicluster domain-containing protein [candidate division WOR-3 bacterium]|nr:4Fe-4S dicluster domain-containing protein [candidate division WOR-3 bacterium]
MKFTLLPAEKISDFVQALSADGAVFYPYLENGKTHLQKYAEGKPFKPDFRRIRTAENVKHFFFPSRHTVARFPNDEKKEFPVTYLFGIKNCDLRGVDVYDRVFLKWEPVDPVYRERRKNVFLISADCPVPEESCFCSLVGLNPYGEGVGDVNFTVVSRGLLFEVFTEKGEEIIKKHQGLFTEAGGEDEKERALIRKEALSKVRKINEKSLKKNLPDRIASAEKSRIRDARGECVECHACLHGCPTCYCFLLSDYKRGSDIERVRAWDACYYAAYARVGGGANPRSRLDERFWNRFQCKFNYFYQYESIYSCSGCGRCWLGCSAKIDIREILWNA